MYFFLFFLSTKPSTNSQIKIFLYNNYLICLFVCGLTKPNQTNPDHSNLDQTKLNRTRPILTKSYLSQTKPKFTKPCIRKNHQTKHLYKFLSNKIQFFLVFYLNDILIKSTRKACNDILIKSTGKHASVAQLLYRHVLVLEITNI